MSQVNNIQNVSRRSFLKQTGVMSTGFVLGVTVPLSQPILAADKTGSDHHEFNLFVSIDQDSTVDIICHRSEMGQGIRTGIPQIVAEELCADWSKVNVVQGLANAAYGSQNTDGSRSIRNFYSAMRQMGAMARTMLEIAASKVWNVSIDSVFAEHNYIINKVTGQKLSFGYLAELAATITPPSVDDLTYKSPKDFKIIGKPIPIVDLPKIVSGDTVFAQDIYVEGMVFASIERSPVIGGAIKSVDKTAALQVAGVIDVIEMPKQSFPVVFKPVNGVAVIAKNTWAALKGRKALKIEWDLGANQSHNSDAYLAELTENIVTKGTAVRSTGDAYQAMSDAKQTLAATYTVPYLVHAPMEPPSATAIVADDHCEIWACTQAPQGVQQSVAATLGLSQQQVKVNVTLLGGGFGRKSKHDFSAEAAILAKQTGKPVKVVWSREDEVRSGYYHAISAQHYQAGLDENDNVTSWIQRSAFPSIIWTFDGKTDGPSDMELSLGFGDMPIKVANLSCEKHKAPAHIRIGWIRSVCNIQHGFALGSFVDEIALSKGKTTHDTWLELLGDTALLDVKAQGFNYKNYDMPIEDYPIDVRKLKHVLNVVVEKSNANQTTAENEGWGISVHRSFLSYVAVASKVRVVNNKVQVLEMHTAIDAGRVINPDRVKSQLEGAMIFGLSITLMGQIDVKDGAVVQSNYHDYPVLRMHQSPVIHTYIVESDALCAGVGEPGVPPVSASVCNAIFRACGQRIRSLPVNKHLTV
ncbi:molybdopterin cofactor-binding domain-containing protein [Paraglaciecola aquimarina]|uniref:Molybdopterin cofactor-binding domain-containing protein n=1 Tax=Paraglaciecola aquimarina TaxID=1235557 RepID=A0ABU3SYU5_9ALTE|nr:molybdopterin cofactor-binding domain-containing protein [Paraglaciecola aquimarina]MDU0355171.1 molybdopterin cofactor-binding domain-containing protein [Paraglaciecola aquimarina]